MADEYKCKEGHKYRAGDAIELGVIRQIWEDPESDTRLFLLIENRMLQAGTFSICTIPKEGITGPVLARFIPASILRAVTKLMETRPTQKTRASNRHNRTIKRRQKTNEEKQTA